MEGKCVIGQGSRSHRTVMVVGCTKKLLDFLKVKPQSSVSEGDALFSWTANLITLGRKRVLVAVNDAARCSFVIYGLKVKDISKLPELIEGGVRAVLRSEYVAPEIIERYLDDCGRELTVTATASRSAVANCNKMCERVKCFEYMFEPDLMFQEKYMPLINDYAIHKDGYALIYEKLISMLTERYGAPVHSAHAAELEVTLDLLTPCKRTLVVPSDLNFYQFHNILQGAFEWHDYHLHQFVLTRDKYKRPLKIICQCYMEDEDLLELDKRLETVDSTTVTVREIFEAQNKIEYEYDFGDGWTHTIKLKRFIPDCTAPYPHCTKAVGDAPMEDSGGPSGFDEKMKILNDPEHPDHEEISMWVESAWWKPLEFKSINDRIAQRHRLCVPVIQYY